MSICRDAIDEVGHAGLIQFNGGIGCDMRLWRQVGQQLPEGVEADEIEGLELDKVARKRNQHGRNVLERRLFAFVDCRGQRIVVGFDGGQDAVDDEMLLFEADGGQFFTPREVIRAMVHTVGPKLGQTVYDPCCGTGGFLAVAYEHIARGLGSAPASTDIEKLKHDTFFGREKENLVFPIALANLVLHGIDQPNLWHGNALTKRATYDALFRQAPGQFDVILTNPPFGGKEGKEAQKNFAFETGSTQVLFVQDILGELEKPGRDPRPDFKVARFNEGVEGIADLKEGMVLEGTVSNVAQFGAFIDLGVHQDGLVHVSQLAHKFVSDAREVVKTGDIVKVKVLEVDVPRKRISLTMKLDAAPARRDGPRDNRFEGAGRSQQAPRRPPEAPVASSMAAAFAKLQTKGR